MLTHSFYLKHQKAINIIFPLILGLSILVWLYPFKNYVYGEGNLLFINPFSFNISPFMQFHYSISYTFPVSDGAPFAFLDILVFLTNKLSGSIVFSEDLLLVFLSILQAYGIFFFLRTLDDIDHNGSHNFLPLSIVAALFMFNPFTLSITWWSLQGWTLFYILSPYILGILLHVSFSKEINKFLYLKVVIVLIVLSPGLNGAYAVPFLYSILFFMVYLIFKLFTSNRSKQVFFSSLSRIFLIVLPGIMIEVPIFLPYVLLPLHGQIAPGYVTTANLINSFIYQSQTTQFFRVASLMAFNWVYNAPLTYPWIGYLPFMSTVSLLLIFFLILGIFYLKTERTVKFMFLFMVIPFFLSMGDNFPVGNINLFLIKLGGPFYVITNGYYILGQLYVIALLGLIFTILNKHTADLLNANATKTKRVSNEIKHKMKSKPRFFANISKNKKRAIIYVLVLLLLLTYVVPFFSYGVYKESGPYSTEINIPNSFKNLNQYFAKNYSGPIYNVLVLPLSSNGVFYAKINQSSWQDNGQFISSFIPYPLIQSNNSDASYIIDNFLSTNYSYNLAPLFQYFHIKYVVIDPFYNNTVSNMFENSKGERINYTLVSTELERNFGAATNIGGFLVYSVRSVSPILLVTKELFYSTSTNDSEFFDILTSMNATNNYIGAVFLNTVLVSNPIKHAQNISFEKVISQSETYLIPDKNVPFGILQNGSVIEFSSTNVSYSRYGVSSINSTQININLSLVTNVSQEIKYIVMAPLRNITNSIDYNFVISFNGNFKITFKNPTDSNVFISLAYPDFLGLWKVNAQTYIKSDSQFQTIFYVNTVPPNLNIDYSVNFDTGLFIEAGELSTTIILLIVLWVLYERYDNR